MTQISVVSPLWGVILAMNGMENLRESCFPIMGVILTGVILVFRRQHQWESQLFPYYGGYSSYNL